MLKAKKIRIINTLVVATLLLAVSSLYISVSQSAYAVESGRVQIAQNEGGSAAPQGGGLSSTPQTDQEIKNNPIYARLQTVVNFLSAGVGIVITISVVIAGYQYIMSKGDPSKTKAAVDRLWNAGIAIFLYVFMYVIINWLIPGGTLL